MTTIRPSVHKVVIKDAGGDNKYTYIYIYIYIYEASYIYFKDSHERIRTTIICRLYQSAFFFICRLYQSAFFFIDTQTLLQYRYCTFFFYIVYVRSTRQGDFLFVYSVLYWMFVFCYSEKTKKMYLYWLIIIRIIDQYLQYPTNTIQYRSYDKQESVV